MDCFDVVDYYVFDQSNQWSSQKSVISASLFYRPSGATGLLPSPNTKVVWLKKISGFCAQGPEVTWCLSDLTNSHAAPFIVCDLRRILFVFSFIPSASTLLSSRGSFRNTLFTRGGANYATHITSPNFAKYCACSKEFGFFDSPPNCNLIAIIWEILFPSCQVSTEHVNGLLRSVTFLVIFLSSTLSWESINIRSNVFQCDKLYKCYIFPLKILLQ